MLAPTCDVLVIGGGPAGLRAAELVSAAGCFTVLADRMPSVGRKFLVAGRGGLNLTHSEPERNFPGRYGTETERWQNLITEFSPTDLRAWVEGLEVETFIGTSGRVFPTGKQAAPLLRRWVARLRRQGVHFATRHEWISLRLEGNEMVTEFLTAGGTVSQRSRSLILALGGASWPQTGSNGKWVSIFEQAGIALTPLTPANCGYEVEWPTGFLEIAEGAPLKNLVVRAGEAETAGELLITRHGLEGGALYQLGRTLRSMAHPAVQIDLKPTFTVDQLRAKLAATPGSDPLARAARAWRLTPAAAALLGLKRPFASDEAAAFTAKNISVLLGGPRPIAEAISTAGGIDWDELNDSLMLKKWPGVFCAGEMIDWDAPTGGYLLQGCLSTGTRAARGAIAFLPPMESEKKLPSRRGSL